MYLYEAPVALRGGHLHFAKPDTPAWVGDDANMMFPLVALIHTHP